MRMDSIPRTGDAGTERAVRNSEEVCAVEFLLVALLGLPTDPPLYDRGRFPPREVAYEAMVLNRAYRRHVETRRWTSLHERDYWATVLQETDYLFHCWDWLHAAQGGEGRDQQYWQYALKRLRDLLGEDAYHAGQMPPAVPLWRFRRMD